MLLVHTGRVCSLPSLPTCSRNVRVNTVKNPGVSDFADVKPGRQTKPMERAEQEFNLSDMITKCASWQQVKALVAEAPQRFERSHALTSSALVRTADLVGPLAAVKKGVDRAAARSFINELSDLLVPRMDSMRGQAICALVLSLKRLDYTQPKLMQGIFYYLAEKERMERPDPSVAPEDRPKSKMVFTVAERFAILSAFAQMGVRPPAEAVARVLDNSYSFMKFCTAQDICNLVQPLHGWHGRVRLKFASRLAFEARNHLAGLDGRSLVSLISLLGDASYCANNYTAADLLQALEPHLGSLPEPQLYPSLMYALMRMRIKTPPDVFDTLCTCLMEAAPAAAAPAAAAKRKAAAAKEVVAAPPRMQVLSARQLVVVLAVLGVQHKYTAERALLDQLLGCLQHKTNELSPLEAACAVMVLPSVLTEADAREDACEVVDELLAVMEGGLLDMAASQLQRVAQTLAALGHVPDGFWTQAFLAELQGRVMGDGRPSRQARTGRPGLVSLAGAYAALPKPEVVPEDAATFASSLARQAAGMGGFGEEQLRQLRGYLSALGLDVAALELPVADEAEAEGLEQKGEQGQGEAAGDAAGDADDADAAQKDRHSPADFLGYAELDYDLVEVLRSVASFRANAEVEAQATAEGRQRAAQRRHERDSDAVAAGQDQAWGAGDGWYQGGGDESGALAQEWVDEDRQGQGKGRFGSRDQSYAGRSSQGRGYGDDSSWGGGSGYGQDRGSSGYSQGAARFADGYGAAGQQEQWDEPEEYSRRQPAQRGGSGAGPAGQYGYGEDYGSREPAQRAWAPAQDWEEPAEQQPQRRSSAARSSQAVRSNDNYLDDEEGTWPGPNSSEPAAGQADSADPKGDMPIIRSTRAGRGRGSR